MKKFEHPIFDFAIIDSNERLQIWRRERERENKVGEKCEGEKHLRREKFGCEKKWRKEKFVDKRNNGREINLKVRVTIKKKRSKEDDERRERNKYLK